MNIKTGLGKLSKAERQKLIVSELQASPTIRASDLASELSVSTETIRRDLDELKDLGLISRTYGGAARPITAELDVNQRDQLYLRQREIIAKEVSSFINHGDILIIGGGMTTPLVARRLAAEKHDLTVITDSYAIAPYYQAIQLLEYKCVLEPIIQRKAVFTDQKPQNIYVLYMLSM